MSSLPVRNARSSANPHPIGWLDIAIVLIAGYAHSISLAWPFGSYLGLGLVAGQPLWWLQLLALGLLVSRLYADRTAVQAAWLGGCFGTAMLSGTFWWLFISLHTYGGLATPLAALAVVLLAALLAVYYAVACAAYVRWAPAALLPRAVLFAALWLCAELARVQFFTGFPWGEAGYAHVDGWARPLAAWVGVHGLSFIAAAVAAGLALAVSRRRWVLAGSGTLLAVALAYAPLQGAPDGQAATAQPLGVTLLQGNIAQDDKFQADTGVANALEWYGQALLSATTPLVVTPETALPLLPQQLPEGYLQRLDDHFASGAQAALVGMPLGSYEAGYANAVIGLQPGQSRPYVYEKHHLVPFGEFVPTGFRWFTQLMQIPLGDFNRGSVVPPPFTWQGQRLGANICYEDLFGEELGARFSEPAQAPTVLVNLSNIAWFGNSVAIDQHLHISRMRALEFSRPMIRATNTGATVIIDYQGRVTHALPRHTRGALVGEVEGRNGTTPYAWWVARGGLWPLWALGVGVSAWAWAAARRRRRLPLPATP